MKHSHYFKNVSHLQYIDVYRVIDLWQVTDPCVQHAIKKLLNAGQRGAKPAHQDIQEAIDTLERWKKMRAEDETATSEAPSMSNATRPSWDDAPEWARWLAQDEDGEWFWFGEKPKIDDDFWFVRGNDCDFAATGSKNPNWRDTLEQRP